MRRSGLLLRRRRIETRDAPLSVPAFSSMTALISVGLLERIASSIALRSSAGVAATTPTPPKASISFS
jgi:hypothetical protein